MEIIDSQLDLVMRAAWADSTLRTRNSQWKRYIDFCMANDLIPIPGDVLSIARFLVNLAGSCKYSTCNNYLSAIIALHKFFGHPGDFRQCFCYTNGDEGIRTPPWQTGRSKDRFDSFGVVANVSQSRFV